MSIKLEDARRITAAAEKKANEIGQPMNIAVADRGGKPGVACPHGWRMARQHRHIHQEGLSLARLRYRDKRPGDALAVGRPVLRHSRFERWKDHDLRRGIPLKKDGKVVGAVGVSAGSGEQDHAVAEAGAAAF